MNNKLPFVVVLLLTYNGKKLLQDSIPTYLKNNYSNFKVVVIDNGSSNGTKDFVKSHFPEVDLIRLDKNRGYSGGFNFGLQYSTKDLNADFVLVSNDDVIADKNLISQLVEVANTNNQIGFVTGKVFFYNSDSEGNILQTVGKMSDSYSIVGNHIGGGELDEGQFDKVVERDFIDDVYMLVRSDLIDKTGGYDEDFFMQYEESDWQIRSKKLGYKIYFTPHAKLWHKVGMSTGGKDSPLRNFNYEKSRFMLIRKHTSSNHILKYLFIKLLFREASMDSGFSSLIMLLKKFASFDVKIFLISFIFIFSNIVNYLS